MRFQNGTGTLEVLQKTKNAFPRWARSVVFLCSHPARERDFCFLQHLCSESARFSPAKMGEPPGDLCSRFTFIYEKRFRPPGARFGPRGRQNRKKPKRIQSHAKKLQRFISTNFDAGSLNLASERLETAGNLIFRYFFYKNSKIGPQKNRLSPTHALISTNFDAGSLNLAPESLETAGNLDF